MFPNHQAYSNMYYKRRVKPTKRRKFLTCRNDLKSTKTTISIPGLNRILDPSYSKLTKIIWIIIVVFCAIVCLTFTVKQIKKYFEFTIESNTIIHKKQKVQFPTFSICTVIEDKYFINMLKQEVKEKCNEYKRENCIENTKNILFSDLDISLLNIWQAFAIKNISVAIWGVSNSNNTTLDPDYNFESKHFSLGSCRIIKKTKPVSYFSVVTRLIVKMELSNLNQDLIFIPHGNLDFNIYEFEILSHEVEFLEVGGENQFKIKEEAFNFLNVTGRECYDDTKEGERIKQLVYNIITPDTCRLPFMPSKFPECLTLNNVTKSVKNETLQSENC